MTKDSDCATELHFCMYFIAFAISRLLLVDESTSLTLLMVASSNLFKSSIFNTFMVTLTPLIECSAKGPIPIQERRLATIIHERGKIA